MHMPSCRGLSFLQGCESFLGQQLYAIANSAKLRTLNVARLKMTKRQSDPWLKQNLIIRLSVI
jgi:hypothetical protein